MGVILKIKLFAYETHEIFDKHYNNNFIFLLFINYIKSQLHVIMKIEPNYIFQQVDLAGTSRLLTYLCESNPYETNDLFFKCMEILQVIHPLGKAQVHGL